ncbi:TetR/AcrR family transcriptional regulator [Leucobacter sp. HNU]|uniref:TetR/AcrR family transcriptional regulator n=1 Tax=Leucobacter sp. HNU TaxID=3236805 RepID=UPI003A7FDC19
MESAPSLTARRKADTRLAIARAAAARFAEHGASRVTAEAIAAAAGVSLRTFYRYFPTKEDAVAPLLGIGAASWQDALAASPPGDPRTAIPEIIDHLLIPAGDAEREGLRWTRGLLRAMIEDPALRAVWHRVNHDSETRLRAIVAELEGETADPFQVRLLAAAATDAIRIGLEHWSESDADPDGSGGTPAALARRAFAELSSGVSER